MITATNEWKATYPGASIGYIVVSNVTNPPTDAKLDLEKKQLEQDLQEKFGTYDRKALKSLPVLQAYADYYRQFGKTYHVQLQLESVALKGKAIPSVAALVETMFMAELKNCLLTAIHDLDQIEGQLMVGIGTGQETYIKMNGKEQVTKSGDMMISDSIGILSSIVYGPDRRTQVQSGTTSAFYTVYSPVNISSELVEVHLNDIFRYVTIVSPDARIEDRGVISG